MPVSITADCINCDMCAPECPNVAIYRAEPHYQVNPELCTECVGFYDKPACIEVCPIDCIFLLPTAAEVQAI
jgi:ferredoxin